MNNGATSEMNSNIYRNVDSTQISQGRNRSTRSTVSCKKKRKKHYSSIGQTLEKQRTVDVSRSKNFTNQLISLIQKIHSPKSIKSHNHSHSEVQSQAVKCIVKPKNRHSYKVSKKSSMHVRSNTSENANKVRMKINPFQDYNNAFQSINQDTTLVSPSKNSNMLDIDSKSQNRLTIDNQFCSSTASHQKSKSKSKKNSKLLFFMMIKIVSCQNPMTPQTQGNMSNENTFMFQKPHNKSL